MKCNIKGCGKIEGGRFEDGICLPCYLFITTGERAWVGLTEEAKTELLTALRKIKKGTREMNDLIERLRLGDGTSADHELLLEAADALEALAQPEQEPVAYGTWDTMLGKGHRMMMVRLDKGQDGCTVPLYITPPQRTWVDLSDEETRGCIEATIEITDPLLLDAVNAVIVDVERLLREKNTKGQK